MHNYLGYAYRKNGDLEIAILSYKEALRLNPKHTRAHNYIGMAYLKLGNIDKARFHLEKLAQLCEERCKEYKTLKKLFYETFNNEN